MARLVHARPELAGIPLGSSDVGARRRGDRPCSAGGVISSSSSSASLCSKSAPRSCTSWLHGRVHTASPRSPTGKGSRPPRCRSRRSRLSSWGWSTWTSLPAGPAGTRAGDGGGLVAVGLLRPTWASTSLRHVFGVILGVAIPVALFRAFVPNDAFPVTYRRRGKSAHLDVGGRRGDAITRALRESLASRSSR